ncbi:MAG: hypothetical protein MJY84_01845 [Bacteroidales bacterium]|nr:hypothetical protein [Bacteroidales bacterium]
MKRFIISLLAVMVALAPAGAQNRKAVKRAKEDAKYELKYLSSEGYKALDNIKLEDAVKSFLTEKYSSKSAVEVVGKATGVKDLNEGKAEARNDAVSVYPAEDVNEMFFVYRKNRKKFDVICYALVEGASAPAARNNPAQFGKKGVGMDYCIDSMKEEQAQKEAKQAEKQAKAKAKKQAKKQAKKDKAKAEKAAAKAAEKAYDAQMKKSGY